LKYRH